MDISNTPKPKKHRRPWIEWGREVGMAECPYLKRWVLDLRLFSIRLHNFRGSDDSRAMHDHSWGFITFILKGYYDDVTPDGRERMNRGKISYRPPHHIHTVEVGPDGVWTIILTGPRVRDWGFWSYTKGGKFRWFNHRKYFAQFGHHPCSDSQRNDKIPHDEANYTF